MSEPAHPICVPARSGRQTGRLLTAPVGAALMVVLVALLCLAVDSVPRFHMDDSKAYLETAIGVYLPDDRSWTYGLVIQRVLHATGQLRAALVLQVCLSAFAAAMLAWSLTWRLSLPPLGFWACFAALFLNPLEVYWAREFMTDVPADACLALMAAVLLAGWRLAWTSFWVLVLSFILFSLRSVFFLPLLLAMGAVSALGLARLPGSTGWAKSAGPAVARRYGACAAAVLAAYLGYAALNQAVTGGQGLRANYAAARFLTSAWSPVLGPVLDRSGLDAGERAQLAPLTDAYRVAHAFAWRGLDSTLKRHFGSHAAAQPAHERLLRAALLEQTWPLAGLILRSWGSYLDADLVLTYHRERRWTGTTNFQQPNLLPDDLLAHLRALGVRDTLTATMPQASSPGLDYVTRLGGLWHLLLAGYATAAILVLPLLVWRGARPELVMLTLFAFLYMAMLACTSNALVPRYLLPLSIPFVTTVAAAAACARLGWRGKHGQAATRCA